MGRLLDGSGLGHPPNSLLKLLFSCNSRSSLIECEQSACRSTFCQYGKQIYFYNPALGSILNGSLFCPECSDFLSFLLNPGPPEYDAGVLTTRPRSSVL
jgi:hypothetical protein